LKETGVRAMQNVIEGFKDKDKQANVATSEFVMKQ
jgi:hypothetical protein